MNATRQSVHVLMKDIRAHALEIGLVLVLNVFLALTLTVTWQEHLMIQGSRPGPIGDAAQVLLIVACLALIGRVMQADGLAGKAPYWLTRPCSRPALLASKLAFVLLFVHLPTFLSQLAIVTGSGVPLSLPQLVANQAAFAAGVSLPLIALASVTTTFSRFVLGGVVVFALALPMYDAVLSPSTTFRSAAALAMLASIAGMALACQYRWRSTRRIAVWCLVTLSLLFLGMMPPSMRFVRRATADTFPPPTVASTIRLGDASERVELRYPPPFVSLAIEGLNTDNTSVRHYEVEIRSADGRELDLARVRADAGPGARLRFTPENDLWLDLQLSAVDYDALDDGPISVRLVIDIVTFEDRETEPIPLDGSFAIVDGRAQCGLKNPFAIACRTSFGGQSMWSMDSSNTMTRLVWRPISLRLALNPIETAPIVARPLTSIPGTSIATFRREPVSYTRQDVTFENIRIGDWRP